MSKTCIPGNALRALILKRQLTEYKALGLKLTNSIHSGLLVFSLISAFTFCIPAGALQTFFGLKSVLGSQVCMSWGLAANSCTWGIWKDPCLDSRASLWPQDGFLLLPTHLLFTILPDSTANHLLRKKKKLLPEGCCLFSNLVLINLMWYLVSIVYEYNMGIMQTE